MSITADIRREAQGRSFTEVLVASESWPPDARVTAAAKGRPVGENAVRAAVVHFERKGAEAGAVGDQQSRYVVFLDDWNAPRGDLAASVCKMARPSSRRVAGAPPPVGAENRDRCASSVRANSHPTRQLLHAAGASAHQYLRRPEDPER